jgi:hypothetical protein
VFDETRIFGIEYKFFSVDTIHTDSDTLFTCCDIQGFHALPFNPPMTGGSIVMRPA